MRIKDKKKLINSGFLPTDDGNVLLSGPADNLFVKWREFLSYLLKQYYSVKCTAPLFINRQILERSKYLRHFPHQLFLSGSISNSSEKQFITPASCLHIYPLIKDTIMRNKEFNVLIYGRCARQENNQWRPPFRLSGFHMLELVLIGSEDVISRRVVEIQSLLQKIFYSFDFRGVFSPATDAFFLGNDEGAKVVQKLKELKKEYVTTLNGKNIYLASINNHEGYFGKRFNIRVDKDIKAYSACIAFGLERLTAYSLLVWGENQKDWPEKFKK